MGEAIINTLRSLSVLQKGVLVVLLLAAAGAVYGVYLWGSGSGQDALEENKQLIPVSTGNLVDQVSISGSLVFPTKEVLKFGAEGVVEEIWVEEGDTVEAGQVIGVLDLETRATLRQEVDDARVKLKEAKESVADIENSLYSPGLGASGGKDYQVNGPSQGRAGGVGRIAGSHVLGGGYGQG